MTNINDKEYDEKLVNSKGVAILDFYASWCGPCRMLGPVLEEIEEENNVTLFKMDVDENEKTPRQFGVLSIPTVCIFKDGEFKEKFVGFRDKEDIVDLIKKYL